MSTADATDGNIRIGSLEIQRMNAGGLRLAGEIDLSNAESISKAIAEMVSGQGPLSLDLSELQFIDSTGVQMLLSLARSYGERGERLVLERPQGVVRRVFDVMQIEQAPELEIRWD